ncbi:hypothetical protein B0O80DRAFT_434771 [Mortierella sp. GBAus27b]|nr:hypothetical protein BGX31_008129 [Mortierella sp. GBA43]KAI8361965.1 hypothetical protein B0O80DRAFT_434771 [Mortierella sp. GBAus27b]
MALVIQHPPSLDEDLALALQLSAMDNHSYQVEGFDGHNDVYVDEDAYTDEEPYTDEDLYMDGDFYGDIRVSPPQSKSTKNKNKNKDYSHTAKQALFTKIVQPVVDCPSKSLVFPPEVLDLLCSYLSQTTLRHCVSLVCKDWNVVSDKYICRMGVWTPLDEEYEKYLLAHMKRLDSLECWFKTDPDIPSEGSNLITSTRSRAAWTRFCAAILMPLEEAVEPTLDPTQAQVQPLQDNKDIALKQTCLLHYIKHLSLRGYYLDYKDTLLPMMPQFRFLETLKLEINTGIMSIQLFDLLNSSPNLLELVIRIPNYENINILSGSIEDEIPEPLEEVVNPFTAHFPVKPKVILPPKEFEERYRLRVFDVDKVAIRQHVLERVITTCNELRVFKVTQIHDQKYFGEFGYRDIRIDEERLMKHAKKCCLHLESFTLFRRRGLSDITHLDRTISHFPETRVLSMTCAKELELTNKASALALLPQITVMEVKSSSYAYYDSKMLDSILCMMPNLLHLDASQVIFSPSCLTQLPRDESKGANRSMNFMNNHDRKQREREEKRERREKALLRFQRGASPPTTSDSTMVWACRDLCTLKIRLFDDHLAFKTWSEYVEWGRLFRNLTELRVSCHSFRIGQRKKYCDGAKHRRKSLEASKMNRKPGDQPPKEKESESERLPNELLPLRGLRSLEFLQINASHLDGVLHPSDFEFLRKRDSENVVRIISHDDNMEDPIKKRESDGNDTETFWPRLEAFHVRYYASGMTQSHSAITTGMEIIRPGVQFSIKRRWAWTGII